MQEKHMVTLQGFKTKVTVGAGEMAQQLRRTTLAEDLDLVFSTHLET